MLLFNEDYGEAREQVFQKWNEHLASIFDKNPKEADMFPTTMVEWAYEYMKNGFQRCNAGAARTGYRQSVALQGVAWRNQQSGVAGAKPDGIFNISI